MMFLLYALFSELFTKDVSVAQMALALAMASFLQQYTRGVLPEPPNA